MQASCSLDIRSEQDAHTTTPYLLIIHYPLPITHYPLLITHYPLLITHYPLPITHYPLPITHYPLPNIPILKSFTSRKQNLDIDGIVIPEVTKVVQRSDYEQKS
ncbi:MAG: hypothetical protein AAF316_13480 [Cyanobacteria bacterium P01_A01_bin.80]